MRSCVTFVAIVAVAVGCTFSILAADEEREAAGEDSPTGLPEQYAKDYLIAGSTISPDKKIAVIYPTLASEEAAEDANQPERIKDHIVALQPFALLGELQTKFPHFQKESHGGISAEWSNDSSVALVTLDGKWGPHDVFCSNSAMGSWLERPTSLLRRMICCCQTTANRKLSLTTMFSTSSLMTRTDQFSNSTLQGRRNRWECSD